MGAGRHQARDGTQTPPLSLAIVVDNLDIGGAQRLIEIQATAADARQIRVLNLSRRTPLSERLRAAGVEVVDANVTRLLDQAGLRRAIVTLRAWSPDIVHAHLIHATLIAGYFAARTKTPLVVTLHNEEPDQGGLFARVKNRLDRHVLSHHADTVVACGPRVAAAQAGRVGSARFVTVQNRIRPPAALDVEARLAVRTSLGIRPGDFALLAAGRLERQKGYDILLPAFARARWAHASAKLLLAGDGAERNALEDLAEGLGLGAHVHLLGARSDVDRLLAAADAFVLPSRWEGLPLVLLEALAAGLPVVASAVGDVGTVAGEGGALMVQPDDAEALASALARILEEPALRHALAASGRAAARPYTDAAGLLDELAVIYDGALERSAGGFPARRAGRADTRAPQSLDGCGEGSAS